jgi:hypothetical protein
VLAVGARMSRAERWHCPQCLRNVLGELVAVEGIEERERGGPWEPFRVCASCARKLAPPTLPANDNTRRRRDPRALAPSLRKGGLEFAGGAFVGSAHSGLRKPRKARLRQLPLFPGVS